MNERMGWLALRLLRRAAIMQREGGRSLFKAFGPSSLLTSERWNPFFMWSPLRARKLVADGSLQPFVPFETFGNPATLNCDRDSQGDVLFADMSCSVVRPHCLDHLEEGLLPQKWMGQKIAPIHQEAGCDVDYEWQVPGVEWWLKKYWDVKREDD